MYSRLLRVDFDEKYEEIRYRSGEICTKIYNFASSLEKDGYPMEAKDIFGSLLYSNYHPGGAYFHLGCIHKRMGEIEKAKYHFEECLKLIPDHGKGWESLTTIYLQQNRSKELEERFKEALSSCKEKEARCNVLIQMASFYSQLQRYKEAEKTLNKALSLNPPANTLASIHYALASLYERKGDLKRVEEKFEEVVKSGKGIPSFVGGAHFHLGCIHQRMGEIKEARSHFEECLKFIPDHRKAKENLKSLKEGLKSMRN
jgi:tetratricopeptide (TPR) repeat protein